MVGAAPARLAFWSPQIRLPLVDAERVDDGSVGVSPRGRRGDDDAFVKWESCPRAFCRCAAVSSVAGVWLLRYVSGGFSDWVASRPAWIWWLKVDGSVVGVPFRSRRCVDLRSGEGWRWRCSFIVLGSAALRRTAPVFEAWRSSPVVVRKWCGFVFSGDGEGIAGVLGRVFPCVFLCWHMYCTLFFVFSEIYMQFLKKVPRQLVLIWWSFT